MRDGFTRNLEVAEHDGRFEDYLSKWRATVVILSGEEAGTEKPLTRPNLSIGRAGDWSIDDDTMSKEHAAIEFADGGFRLRDLGSRNGTRLNGKDVKAAELSNGDRFQLGQHEFQFVLEKQSRGPKTYVVPDA